MDMDSRATSFATSVDSDDLQSQNDRMHEEVAKQDKQRITDTLKDVFREVAGGNRLAAIKMIRDITGLGVAEAKMLIEGKLTT